MTVYLSDHPCNANFNVTLLDVLNVAVFLWADHPILGSTSFFSRGKSLAREWQDQGRDQCGKAPFNVKYDT